MSDIFISYAREDRAAAERVADALKSRGWSVWWDPEIPPGEVWDARIERELASVPCVLVLWSATSGRKPWVRAEAAEALSRGVLVPVLIEAVDPPLAFRHVQAADLADWRGEPDHPGFEQLLCTIGRLSSSGPRPDGALGRGKGTRAVSAVDPVPELRPLPRAAGPRPPPRAGMGAAPPHARPWAARLALAGRAAALLLLGGTIGYVLNDGAQRFGERPLAGEAARTGSLGSTAPGDCEGTDAAPDDR
jgi:hypothetical protein